MPYLLALCCYTSLVGIASCWDVGSARKTAACARVQCMGTDLSTKQLKSICPFDNTYLLTNISVQQSWVVNSTLREEVRGVGCAQNTLTALGLPEERSD